MKRERARRRRARREQSAMSDQHDPDDDASAVEQTYARLKRDIIDGARAPGERMRIERMRKLYDVGPTPMRETLQRLTAEGLVIARSGRGFLVAPLVAEEFADLNLARTEAECAALRLSIASGGEEWETAIVAAAYRLEKADRALLDETGEGPVAKWESANRAFHAALISACPSATLLRFCADVNDKCERYRRAALPSTRRLRDLASEHEALRAAALERDVEAAVGLLAAHYGRTLKLFADRPAASAEKRGRDDAAA
jgi:DNA-binding GntR family transcriptional regulator